MRTFFWSVITIILILVVISLVLYSGEEEEVTEPLPEAISNMIGDLRAAVDEMEQNYINMNEITAIALTAKKTQNSINWFTEAENTQATIIDIFNTKVLPLNRRLTSGDLSESAQKQVDEFRSRSYRFISNDSRRDILVAKNTINLGVSSDDWLALAGMYKNVTDTYERNIGLKTLGETVEKFDRVLGGKIYNMIDAPFVQAIYEAENPATTAVGPLVSRLKDSFLIMQVLITYGKKNLNNDVVDILAGLLDKVDDENEKAYFASHILLQLPNIPDNARTRFFAAIENADDLLMVETKLGLIENGGATGSTRKLYLDDIEEVVDIIPQNYPRERLLARLIMLKKEDTIDDILNALEVIESVTLREEVLTYIAINKENCNEGDFERIIDVMQDPYSKLVANLDNFYKQNREGEQAAAYLTALEEYAEEIKQAGPLIDLTTAWGTVDPFQARQSLNRFNTKDKVDAAVALIKTLNNKSTVSTILNDVYAELSSSKIFEPVEKSQLLRILAGPMMNINPSKATKMLEEAYLLVVEQQVLS